MTPVVFVDRDGVIVDETGYLTSREQLRLIPRATEALRKLRAGGFKIVVATNQSAVARGMLTASGLADIHDRLRGMLAAEGAFLDGIFVCMHHPEAVVEDYRRRCDCRKPAPGLLCDAAQQLGLALDERSYFVGDQPSDAECARRAGVRPVLVRTGKGSAVDLSSLAVTPLVFDSLYAFADALLDQRLQGTSVQ